VIEARRHAAELSEAQLLGMYELMLTGRLLETRLHTMYRGGRLSGAVYPGVGQEAAQVGIASALVPGMSSVAPIAIFSRNSREG